MYSKKRFKNIAALTAGLLIAIPTVSQAKSDNDFKAVVEEAYIYAFPMIMAYDVLHQYAIDTDSPEYKAPFNHIKNEARVFTPKDTAVITPNSDTPYSMLTMDLRAEPIVLCVPKIEKERYYSVQLISLYTFNFGYIGSRATGNEAGCYAVAGPHWKGEIPKGITKVFQSETDLAFGIYRTQLFNPADLDNVKKIQAEYKVQPLSAFLNTTPPKPAPEIEWLAIDGKMAKENPFAYLNFLLQFAPAIGTAAAEVPLREKFAKIGIEANKPFDIEKLTPEQKTALTEAMQSGLEKIKTTIPQLGKDENGWIVVTKENGNREALKGNWATRAAIAMAGIFANDPIEAVYPLSKADDKGQKLEGNKKYTITFKADQLPPVNAFWSVTMYDAKTQLLVKNPINRYLINSPMLPNLIKNTDGSITLYIQKDSPGKDKEANWLPAAADGMYLVMRLYWPKEAALKGAWMPPAIVSAS